MHFCIIQGSKINAENSRGDTPLILATKVKNHEVVEELCQHKSLVVNHKNMRGKTALHYAVALNHVNIAVILLKNGSSLLETDNNGYTPVHTACKYGREELLAVMLDKNSTIVSLTTNDGKTPLLVARCALNHSAMIIETLIEKGSDLRKFDHSKNTALHLFSSKDDVDICTTILDKAKEQNIELLNKKNVSLEIPLHVAASHGHLEVCRYFME